MLEGGDEAEQRIEFGFQLATARLPSNKETQILLKLYRERLGRFKSNPEAAKILLAVGDSPQNSQLDSIEHAAWMEVGRLLLNLDETINRD